MNTQLTALDDDAAIRLLTALAAPRLRDPALVTTLTPDLTRALEQTYGPAAEPSSEGDLARQVLHLLAADPEMQPVITAFLKGPEADRFASRRAARPARPSASPWPR